MRKAMIAWFCAASSFGLWSACTNDPNDLPECGNGIVKGSELCDGTDLGGQDCTSIGLGFGGGTLACNTTCDGWNTAGCTTSCGNGQVDAGEVCDDADLGGQDCTSIGLGFDGGTLACNTTCDGWNTAGCTTSCGNGQVDAGEVCDGTDLDGQDCTSIGLGFDGGILACDASCDGFDTTGCVMSTCGNDQIEGNEVCDGTDLDGQDCTSIGLGFNGGTLACDGSCAAFDTTACVTSCGNGQVEWNEQCDGSNLDGNSCTSIAGGFIGGVLSCKPDCSFETSGCIPQGTCTAIDLGGWTGNPISLAAEDSCVGMPSYDTTSSACLGLSSAPGVDMVYALSLAANETVTISYTTDLENVLYVLTSCVDFAAQTCVVGADSTSVSAIPPVEESVVTLTNTNASATIYYIVLDYQQPWVCGIFSLNIT